MVLSESIEALHSERFYVESICNPFSTFQNGHFQLYNYEVQIILIIFHENNDSYEVKAFNNSFIFHLIVDMLWLIIIKNLFTFKTANRFEKVVFVMHKNMTPFIFCTDV